MYASIIPPLQCKTIQNTKKITTINRPVLKGQIPTTATNSNFPSLALMFSPQNQ